MRHFVVHIFGQTFIIIGSQFDPIPLTAETAKEEAIELYNAKAKDGFFGKIRSRKEQLKRIRDAASEINKHINEGKAFSVAVKLVQEKFEFTEPRLLAIATDYYHTNLKTEGTLSDTL